MLTRAFIVSPNINDHYERTVTLNSVATAVNMLSLFSGQGPEKIQT